MNAQMLREVMCSYREIATLCELDNPRAMPWAAANDALLLDRVLRDMDPENDRILDFGCCGWPWITNYLDRAGYDVVGIDVTKPHWFEHNIAQELGISLVGYDGEHLPLSNDGHVFGIYNSTNHRQSYTNSQTNTQPRVRTRNSE